MNYIRLYDGFIAQITRKRESFKYTDDEVITRYEIDRNYNNGEHDYDYVYSSWIEQQDKDLIKLARIGDFINKECIIDIMDDFIITDSAVHHKRCLTNENIESFLTKEQYDKRSYKVKRK